MMTATETHLLWLYTGSLVLALVALIVFIRRLQYRLYGIEHEAGRHGVKERIAVLEDTIEHLSERIRALEVIYTDQNRILRKEYRTFEETAQMLSKFAEGVSPEQQKWSEIAAGLLEGMEKSDEESPRRKAYVKRLRSIGVQI